MNKKYINKNLRKVYNIYYSFFNNISKYEKIFYKISKYVVKNYNS